MRFARSFALVSAAAFATLAIAGSAAATTVVILPDKGTYAVGEAVSLTVTLDLEGAVTFDLYARIEFDPGLLTGIDVITSVDSEVPIPPFPDCGPGYCNVFDHVLSSPIDSVVTAIITLVADSPGFAAITWNPPPGGLVGAPGTSFTIVPEPATGPLLGAGVVLLGLAARRAPPRSGRD